ncbi:MAG: tetratricopeptide repeat protein [Myxococcales bacterium]
MNARQAACIGLAGLLLSSGARALDAGAPPPDRQSAGLWDAVGRPEQRRAHALHEQARRLLADASRQLPTGWREACKRTLSLGRGSDSHAALYGRMRALRQFVRQALRKRALVDSALARLHLALELSPDDPALLFTTADALSRWEQPGPLWGCSVQRRDAKAIELLRRLQRDHPGHRPGDVAARLALVLMRAHRFEEAAATYERQIALDFQTQSPVAQYNMAEALMLSGRLEEALSHYRLAISASRARHQYLPPLWGLAVTLDRLGEHDAALEEAARAMAADGRSMRILRSNDIFFEPGHEVHYYEGLGHEARAGELEGVEKLRALEAAAESYGAFLLGAGQRGAFAREARDNLGRVRQAAASLREKLSATR